MRGILRVPLASAAALLLVAVGASVTRQLAGGAVSVALAVPVVVWLGLETTVIEGAIGAAIVGVLLDAWAGGPSGLLTFLSVLVFVGVRAGAGAFDARTPLGFGLLSGVSTLGMGLGALLLLRYVTPAEAAPGWNLLGGVAIESLLTGLAAPAVQWVLDRVLARVTASRPGLSDEGAALALTPSTSRGDGGGRLLWMAGFAVLAFLVLLSRLYQLQVLRGEEYRVKAEENFVKELRVPADRGLVLDRNRKVLVDSRPSYDVVLIPYFCGKGCDDLVTRLATLLSFSFDEEQRVRDHLATARGLVRFRPFTVKVDISRDELDVVEANRIELSGAVDVLPTPHRSYRHGIWASHLLGYMNEVGPEELVKLNADIEKAGDDVQPYQARDFVGRRGLEKRYEKELRGVDGTQRVVVDARGNAMRESDLIPEAQRFEPSSPGNNLILSIDWRLQEFAEKTFPATAGTVLALDARTGFLLALVDRPAVDPNKLAGRISRAELAEIRADPLQPELFRAIQQHYHPGSTFKVVTAIAALEEGALRPGGTVYCPGRYTLGGHSWRCDKETGHGQVDLEHAIGASCDVFFYSLSDRMGTDKIARWGSLLGLGKPTGLDIQGEIPGVMPDEAWHDAHQPGGHQHGMSLNISIGQGDVNVTPLQQLVLYGALATGKIWRPQVVLRIEDPKGDVMKEFAPEVRGTLPVKPETRDAVMKGLLAAVNQPFGTAWGVRMKDVVMAGKTGTAQVVKLGAKRLKASQVTYFQRDHAWFAAFAPAEDPEIVVVVLNEHSGFGSSNAAPTAAAVVRKWLELKEEDARAREGVQRPAVAPPAAPPPPPPSPGRPQKPARAGAAVPDGGRRGA